MELVDYSCHESMLRWFCFCRVLPFQPIGKTFINAPLGTSIHKKKVGRDSGERQTNLGTHIEWHPICLHFDWL